MKIINAWICQVLNDSRIVPFFGDLEFSDGKITGIIPQKESNSAKPSKDIIDAGGRVVTIPSINFHDHFYSRLAKGLSIKGSTDSFYQILKNLWWKLDIVLDDDMIKASALMAVMESIRNGVTYIFDHHSSPQCSKNSLTEIGNVLRGSGLRGILCFEITDRNGEKLAEEGLKESENFLKIFADDPDIKSLLGLHASFTLTDNSLKKAAALLHKYNTGVHIHLCEDKVDCEISRESFKKSPVERLEHFNLLNSKSILAHGIHLTRDDYKKISKSGSAIAFNPDSNLNNAVGLPSYINYTGDIPILAGTDGMNSNPARSLKQLFLLSRHQGMSFDESFKWINKIYFDQVDFVKKYFPDFTSLQVGDRADFVIWDYVPPTPFSKDNFWGHYVYGILDRPVHSVVQNGKVLMNDFNIIQDFSEQQKFIKEQGKILFNKFLNFKN